MLRQLLILLSFQLTLPVMAASKYHIEYENQHGYYRHFQTKYNEADARRVMINRSQSTGLRHRLIDDNGTIVDLYTPRIPCS